MHKRLLFALSLLPLAAFGLALWPAPTLASGFPASCAGTYLISEAGGARDFWTFAADGSFFGTTSTQPLYNFSNQQGSWEKVGNEGARGALFAFVYDEDNTLMTTARIELVVDTVGQGCDEIAGSLVVRTFEEGEDPLDPSSDTGDPIASDTFTGRRAKPSP
ncbi:hypothetical protein WME89_35260 [Sorangium sp. So ce321]|uniref:hypothetical protein n=1 Tax=Sorangium sp. So ce321 TaxID=3133300 RepID=UPI003F6174B7